MEVGNNFNNIISYTENMAKGLNDKLFFLNQLNINNDKSYLFVDFGCADGILLTTLYEILTNRGINAYYIGYDISDTMIDLAKSKINYSPHNILFTTNWDEVKEKVTLYSNMESVLILSSVVHEVYSYTNNDADIDVFWDRVINTGFKNICVRDMMVSKDTNRSCIISKIADKVDKHTNVCAVSGLYKYKTEFEDIYGKVWENYKNLFHFLLKYRWTINWDREVHENYFPIYVEDFLNKFVEKYNLNYLKRFRVKFLDDCWKEDFGIEENEISDNTHIKTIFTIKHY